MSRPNKDLAVYPGMFDPITNGHVDLIRRGARLFDRLIVAVGDNPDKTSLFSAGQRRRLVQQVVEGLSLANVRVASYTGLTVHFARNEGAGVLLRGIRASSDLHFEVQIAQTNRHLTGVETVFVLPSPECAFISSTLIRQIAQGGGDVSNLVPPEILPALLEATDQDR